MGCFKVVCFVFRILDSTRENIQAENLKRVDLQTKVDICKLKKGYSINDGVRHAIDTVSVDIWIQEYQSNESDTIFHKNQGDNHSLFSQNDMCLIFINSSQECMLKKLEMMV